MDRNKQVPDSSGVEVQGTTQKDVDRLYLLMAGVIIVLFIGFVTSFIAVGGLIVNYESERQATYQNLDNQVQSQNAQIQVLTNQLKNSTVTPK